MTKYQYAPGWNKAKVMERIRKYNNGTPARWVSGVVQSGLCQYQTGDGNRCAIGCFIPDGHPGLDYEGNVKRLLISYPDLWAVMPLSIDIQLLVDFQGVHDETTDGENPQPRIESWLDENMEEPCVA